MPNCQRCGRSAQLGWTDEQPHEYCAPCETTVALNGIRLPYRSSYRTRQERTCVCGCARQGPYRAWGLISICYQRVYRAGALERWKQVYRQSQPHRNGETQI
jgi:hypothetical protein